MKRTYLILLSVWAAAFVTACSGPQWYMEGAGPAAETLATLGWYVLITFLIVTVVMWVLIAAVALRRRGSFEEHAPPDEGGGLSWVFIGGFLIPAAILFAIFIGTLQTMSAFPMEHDPGDPEIRVVGRQWWWEAEYFVDGQRLVAVPTEIHIPVGRPVQIELVTRDVIHSFWVPKLHGKVDLIPGVPNHIRLMAERPGIYRGECAEFCGEQHTHMILYVVAEPEQEYQQWLAGQALPSIPPEDPVALAGREVFMRAACVLCHTIRGTPARATIGPDLTHLATRQRIAGGMLTNNRANLQAWVTHAQSLKPGNRMPDLTAFTGTELNALVTYLQSLK